MKRILSVLLALMMLLSACPLLFSCNDKEDNVEKETEYEEKKYEEDSIFYERSLVSDDLTTVDFGGKELRIVSHMPYEFHVEEATINQGDLIADARFARNEAVEKRFNVKLVKGYSGTYSEVSSYVAKTVMSGADEFDLLLGMSVDTGSLVLKKLFLNWYDIENINFDKPWWAESNKDELTVNGVCPLAISDFCFSSITYTYCMVFNKNLAASYELGNLYETVLDGKWTFDKLTEIVKGIYVDDGNDLRDVSDFYGMAHSSGSSVNTYLWAFDNPVCKKDEEGIPQITVKTDKINNIVNDIYELIYHTGGVYFEPNAVSGATYATDMFLSKKAIFIPTILGAFASTDYRDFEDDYGVIPYPKYDESQRDYHTMADGSHTVLAVPKTCKDTEFVGTIVEALSAETWKTVTPTFYEIALKTRYLRDNESKEVLDLIIDGRVFDFGYIYDGWKGFSFALQKLMRDANPNFESYYSSNYSTAKYRYKAIVKQFAKL